MEEAAALHGPIGLDAFGVPELASHLRRAGGVLVYGEAESHERAGHVLRGWTSVS